MCKFVMALLLASLFATCAGASMLQDFDSFPVTTETPGSIPGAPAGWQYSSNKTNNTGWNESKNSGWRQYPSDPEGDGWLWIFDYSRAGKCASHVGGGDTYGYLSISPNGHVGNALKYHVTGGLQFMDTDPCTGSALGTPLYNLESYTGTSDVTTYGSILGHMYVYFEKIAVWGSLRNYTPFSQVGTSNRMTFYAKMPAETSNGTGGYSHPPSETLQIGTFIDPTNPGGHFYSNVFVQASNGGTDSGTCTGTITQPVSTSTSALTGVMAGVFQ